MDRLNCVCAFTGHRPYKLPFLLDENDIHYTQLKEALTTEIIERIKDGYSKFISGMAWGSDILFAELVLELKREYSHIKLVAAIPHEGQANYWNEDWRNRYFSILEKADEVHMLSQRYMKGCMDKRNRWMVDQSSYLIAVWNGELGGTKNTIAYAQRKGLTISYLGQSNNYCV